MYARPEQPPKTLPHHPFPVGDMIGAPAARAAEKLTNLLTTETDEECRARLRWMRDINYQSWATQPAQSGNAIAVEALADIWDAEQRADGEFGLKAYFVRSFQTSIGFITSTNFLPLHLRDYHSELLEMQQLPLSSLATLVGEAEYAMRQHRYINEILPRLAELQADMYTIPASDTVRYTIIKYGTYLPYVLSSVSQLEGHLSTQLTDAHIEYFTRQARHELGMDD